MKKGGLEKRRISATGRFPLPSLKETSRLSPVYSGLLGEAGRVRVNEWEVLKMKVQPPAA